MEVNRLGKRLGSSRMGMAMPPSLWRKGVDGGLQQTIDHRRDSRGSLVGGLVTDEIGGFLIDIHAGNSALQILELLQNGAAGLFVGLRGSQVVADFVDGVRIVGQGSLAADDILIL